MKKIIVLAMLLLTALGTSVSVYGQANIVVREQVTVTVDRAVVRTDVPPISVAGRVLVPVRSVFEAFNADIAWFPNEKRVFIRKDGTVVWLQIRDAHAKVNDDIVPLEVPAVIYRGRTMVPLRFIAETLGATVRWDPATQTVTIVTKRESTQPPAVTQPAPPPTTVEPAPAPEEEEVPMDDEEY